MLLATRERPGGGRWYRGTNICLRKAKPLAKHIFPAGASSLVLACVRFLLPFRGERAEQLTILFSLFDGKLKKHSESPMVYYAERWINRVRTLRIDARSQRPMRLHRSRGPSSACETHPRTFIPPQGVALVCSECETTETSMWYANRDDKDNPVCVVCYKRQVCHVRRPHASLFHIFVSSYPDPNTCDALFRSSLPAVASAPNAVRMGEIQA